MAKPEAQLEHDYSLAAADPDALASELERAIPLDPETLAQPGIPSGLRLKLARLSVIETVAMALIIAVMCIGVVLAVMHFYVAPRQVPDTVADPAATPPQHNASALPRAGSQPSASVTPGAAAAPSPAPQAPPVPPLPEMLKWRYTFHANKISAPVCAEDGSLFFTLDKTRLVGLAIDGAERYIYEPKGAANAVLTAPAAAESLSIIVGLTDGRIVKLDGWGDPYWEYATDSPVALPVALDRYQMIYCTEENGTVSCIAPQGRLRWRCALNVKCTKSAPVIAGPELVYQVSNAGAAALIAGGRLQWQKELGLNAASPAVSGNQNLYAIDNTGRLAAISVKGEELWRKAFGRQAVAAPCWGEGVVYIANMDGELFAVSEAGTALWRAQLGGKPEGIRRSSKDGRLYIWAQNGKFYAVAKTGELLYSYASDTGVQGMAVSPGGTVYCLSFGEAVALKD